MDDEGRGRKHSGVHTLMEAIARLLDLKKKVRGSKTVKPGGETDSSARLLRSRLLDEARPGKASPARPRASKSQDDDNSSDTPERRG